MKLFIGYEYITIENILLNLVLPTGSFANRELFSWTRKCE